MGDNKKPFPSAERIAALRRETQKLTPLDIPGRSPIHNPVPEGAERIWIAPGLWVDIVPDGEPDSTGTPPPDNSYWPRYKRSDLG